MIIKKKKKKHPCYQGSCRITQFLNQSKVKVQKQAPANFDNHNQGDMDLRTGLFSERLKRAVAGEEGTLLLPVAWVSF